MIECMQRGHTLAQRVLEAARTPELRAKPEQLERGRATVVEHEEPVTDSVAEAFGVPACQRCGCGLAGPFGDRGAAARRHTFSPRSGWRNPLFRERLSAGVLNWIMHKTARDYKQESREVNLALPHPFGRRPNSDSISMQDRKGPPRL